MTPLPHRYTVTLSNRSLHAPPRDAIALGPPPQFGGDDRHWGPEELLIGAVLECVWTTFDAIARRSALTVHDVSGTAVGILDRGAPVPVFTSIELAIELVVGAGDEDRARALLEKAERNCIVTHALNVPLKLVATVTTAAPDIAAG